MLTIYREGFVKLTNAKINTVIYSIYVISISNISIWTKGWVLQFVIKGYVEFKYKSEKAKELLRKRRIINILNSKCL